MKKSKTIGLILAAVAVTMTICGLYVYYQSRNTDKQSVASQSPVNDTNAMAGMDHSMNSMNAELEMLKGDAFDEKFLSLMTEHHAGAVDMAGYVVSDAKHQELRRLGVAIKADQQKEIDQMRQWAKQWGYTFTEPSQQALDAMSAPLKGKKGDDLDKQFITDMSIHHSGALEMAQLALTNAKHVEIKDFANRIITAQTKEIIDMTDWAAAWNYSLEENSNNPHTPKN
ncbi:MAG: DUF305 domain-containing protein [Candidatus Nomurabacteria bacterium]|mgnify:CR=1 FL=1|nr:MAG: DUF305 domain-containing protein [Candidatus Nomurabacteria bacterium]